MGMRWHIEPLALRMKREAFRLPLILTPYGPSLSPWWIPSVSHSQVRKLFQTKLDWKQKQLDDLMMDSEKFPIHEPTENNVPALPHWWTSVGDAGPSLRQRWHRVSSRTAEYSCQTWQVSCLIQMSFWIVLLRLTFWITPPPPGDAHTHHATMKL